MDNTVIETSNTDYNVRIGHIQQTSQELTFAKENLRSLGYSICDSSADKKQLGNAVLSMAKWLHTLTETINSDIQELAKQQLVAVEVE